MVNTPATDQELTGIIKDKVKELNDLMSEALNREIAVEIGMVSRPHQYDSRITVPGFAFRGAFKSLSNPEILIPTK